MRASIGVALNLSGGGLAGAAVAELLLGSVCANNSFTCINCVMACCCGRPASAADRMTAEARDRADWSRA